jgi:hypothetical protein
MTQGIEYIPASAWQDAVYVCLSLVAIFLIFRFVNSILTSQRDSQAKTNENLLKQQQDFIYQREMQWQAFIDQRDEDWKSWMDRSDIRVVDAVHDMAETLKAVTNKLEEHDRRVEERITAATAAVNNVKAQPRNNNK